MSTNTINSIVNELLLILTYKRRSGTKSEAQFIDDFIRPMNGIQEDTYGNFYVQVGEEAPTTLFSCHTDTVHRTDGYQKVLYDANRMEMFVDHTGECLGADDGAGIWLLRRMIEENVPGLYVFHRDEEIGGHGSNHIATVEPGILMGIDRAVAFDRRGTRDIITHQHGKCSSDEFALALAGQLQMNYSPSDGGVFTDTANYVDHIQECTNVSCGYYNEHTNQEIQDVRHVLNLADRLVGVNWNDLPSVRDCSDQGYAGFGGFGGFGSHRSFGGGGLTPRYEPLSDRRISAIIVSEPKVAAELLRRLDATLEDYHDAREYVSFFDEWVPDQEDQVDALDEDWDVLDDSIEAASDSDEDGGDSEIQDEEFEDLLVALEQVGDAKTA